MFLLRETLIMRNCLKSLIFLIAAYAICSAEAFSAEVTLEKRPLGIKFSIPNGVSVTSADGPDFTVFKMRSDGLEMGMYAGHYPQIGRPDGIFIQKIVWIEDYKSQHLWVESKDSDGAVHVVAYVYVGGIANPSSIAHLWGRADASEVQKLKETMKRIFDSIEVDCDFEKEMLPEMSPESIKRRQTIRKNHEGIRNIFEIVSRIFKEQRNETPSMQEP